MNQEVKADLFSKALKRLGFRGEELTKIADEMFACADKSAGRHFVCIDINLQVHHSPWSYQDCRKAFLQRKGVLVGYNLFQFLDRPFREKHIAKNWRQSHRDRLIIAFDLITDETDEYAEDHKKALLREFEWHDAAVHHSMLALEQSMRLFRSLPNVYYIYTHDDQIQQEMFIDWCQRHGFISRPIPKRDGWATASNADPDQADKLYVRWRRDTRKGPPTKTIKGRNTAYDPFERHKLNPLVPLSCNALRRWDWAGRGLAPLCQGYIPIDSLRPPSCSNCSNSGTKVFQLMRREVI